MGCGLRDQNHLGPKIAIWTVQNFFLFIEVIKSKDVCDGGDGIFFFIKNADHC